MSRSSRKNNRRRGVAATEFAVCLPVLMLILLGSIECCSMIFLRQALAVAAYEGAHTALLPGATAADAAGTAQTVLDDRRVVDATIEVLPSNLDDVAEGEHFEVRVSASTDANQLLPLKFFGGRNLSASAIFRKEI